MSTSSDLSVAALAGFGCRCALCAGALGLGETGGAAGTAGADWIRPAGDPPSYIAALLPSGTPRWGTGAIGTAATVTYSFMESVPSYAGTDDRNGFAAMSTAQRAAVRQALAAWSEVANITFTEVADTGSGGSIRLGTNRQSGVSVGYAYYPSPHFAAAGDLYLANDSSSNDSPTPGSYGFKTLLHEIGHAIGLKHPGNYNAGGGGTEGPYLPSAEDNYQYTLMAYNSHPSLGYNGLPTGPALYDIAAIQYLYGVNTRTRASTDTYSFTETTAAFSRTIWDAAGLDTIDASQQTRAVTINLRPGSFSSIGSNGAGESAVGNVAIAYGVDIENAAGGAGDDILIGNDLTNILSGGSGNDTLTGGGSTDTIDGGAGIDTAVFSADRSSYTIVRAASGSSITITQRNNGSDSIDTLIDVEYAQFSDRRVSLRPPTVAAAAVSVTIGSSVQGTALFTATDSDGAAFSDYELVDGSAGGGYFSLAGAPQRPGTVVSVTAAALAGLSFVAGTAEGSDQISVRAYNGILWSDWVSWGLATKRPNQKPVVQSGRTVSLQEGGPATSLGITLPVDPDGDAMTVAIQDLPGNGTLRLSNGAAVAAGSAIAVTDLSGLTFMPAAGFSGSAGSFAYTVSDGHGGSAQQTLSLQVLSLASQLAGFDPLVYLASNADVAAALGTDTAAARQHFISAGRFEGRGTGSFDPYAYIALNPDVAAAVGTDRTAALTHYIQYGRREGRPTSGFSARAYLAANPDLLSVFGADEAAAVNHYLQFGRREGRSTSFDAMAYLAANPDLAETFGASETAAIDHYLQYGRREGRSTSFDAPAYLAANNDLLSALGSNLVAAERHYVQYGRREGRPLAFDTQSYLAANPDVAAVVGGNSSAAALHYVQYGFAEGRSVRRQAAASAALGPSSSTIYGGLLAGVG